jgi:hypothetical protein
VTDKRLFLALAPLALLAACGKQAPADDSRSASGKVLEGTISDAMLPVDTVQSQPPFEDPKAAEKVAAQAAHEPGAVSAAAATDAPPDAAATPAEEPTPEAED